MATVESLKDKYDQLGERFERRTEGAVDPGCLLVFDYEYPGQDAEVAIDTQEFTAACPWSDLPDFGALKVTYVPDRLCIELKSLKYYLLSYAGVGTVQEHAANRVLNDPGRRLPAAANDSDAGLQASRRTAHAGDRTAREILERVRKDRDHPSTGFPRYVPMPNRDYSG